MAGSDRSGRGAAGFRKEYEACRAEAAKANSSSAKEQWLLFADEWLKLALSAEGQQREASIKRSVPTA
jgi:hypothetical protein